MNTATDTASFHRGSRPRSPLMQSTTQLLGIRRQLGTTHHGEEYRHVVVSLEKTVTLLDNQQSCPDAIGIDPPRLRKLLNIPENIWSRQPALLSEQIITLADYLERHIFSFVLGTTAEVTIVEAEVTMAEFERLANPERATHCELLTLLRGIAATEAKETEHAE